MENAGYDSINSQVNRTKTIFRRYHSGAENAMQNVRMTDIVRFPAPLVKLGLGELAMTMTDPPSPSLWHLVP